MRKEASLEQWKVLYEVATRIKELKTAQKKIRCFTVFSVGAENVMV